MRVLYVASRSLTMESLELEREITALQRRVDQAGRGGQVHFTFLPDLCLEDFALELARQRPDVLHISVHGETAGLSFATQEGDPVDLSGDGLLALLPHDHLPKVVLLNACNSQSIAERLSSAPLVAIGTTQPITNRAAIASAAVLYDRLLYGASIAAAYGAMQAVVDSLDRGNTSIKMFAPDEMLLSAVLFRGPRIVAKLPSGMKSVTKSRVYAHVGLTGCPPDTTQVCFFTDDPSFVVGKEELEIELSEIVRDMPRGGEVWTEPWNSEGDYRIAACGITGGGETFSASALLSNALEYYANVAGAPEAYREMIPDALKFLRTRSGAGLADWEPWRGKEERG